VKYIICSNFKQHNLAEKLFILIGLFFIVACVSPLYAQNKPLDNWDLEVLAKKDLQIETYVDITNNNALNRVGTNTYLRYGVSKNYELQVNYSSLRQQNILFADDVMQSAGVGIKAFVVDDSKYFPGISVIGRINLTPAPSRFPIYPALNFLFRKEIAKNFVLTGNYEFIFDEQDEEFFNDFSINLDFEVTDWLTTYVGFTGRKTALPTLEMDETQEYIEVATLLWIAEGWRLYPFYNIGLGEGTHDIFNIGLMHHFD